MAITSVFPNPTVKQVIFQIKFPNLFYIDKKIGDFQLKIMKEFPESSLILRKKIIFADNDQGKEIKLPLDAEPDDEYDKKIWQFKSDKGYGLQVSSNILSITSQYHKTYNLDGGNKFREIIKFVIENFFSTVANIPIINRIGLRYVDECPIPVKSNLSFKKNYNTTFPLKRFNLADATEMMFRTVVSVGEYKLIYMESLQFIDEKYKLILDFDGFAENIEITKILETTDKLHEIISDEYEKTIKEPIYKYMKKVK